MEREASEGRLFLAALPDTDTAARIFHLARVLKRAHRFSGRLIAPDRLHASLFFLGGLPERMTLAACETLADVRMPPFEVSFDRTASFRGRPGSRPFVLMGGDGLRLLRSLREAIGDKLARQGLRRRANANFEPHVTLLYDDRSCEDHPLGEPINWRINEFVLIYSHNGHRLRGRWPLRA